MYGEKPDIKFSLQNKTEFENSDTSHYQRLDCLNPSINRSIHPPGLSIRV